MVKRQYLAVDPEDLRVAKGIASFKGITLKKYFRTLIDNEAKEFQHDLQTDLSPYRRRNR